MRISFKTLSCPKEPINEVKQYLSMNCNRKHSNLPLLSSHFHLFYFFSGSWAGKKGWAGGKGVGGGQGEKGGGGGQGEKGVGGGQEKCRP